MQLRLSKSFPRFFAFIFFALFTVLQASNVTAQSTGFANTLAAAASEDKTLSAFYKAANYVPLWVGPGRAKERQKELFSALGQASDHGLPVAAYKLESLKSQARNARSDQELAQLEIAMSQSFLAYARDVQSGVLRPSAVNSEIDRRAPLRDPVRSLVAFAKSSPSGFFKSLPPNSVYYNALKAEKSRLEQLAARNAWGAQIAASKLEPGQSSASIAGLKARLSAMGYKAGKGPVYDAALQSAVAAFQRNHGLSPDGVAGKGTIREINKQPADRLASVIVAMERSRWMNFPLGRRHVWVNLPDFTAKIVDNGSVVFESRSVIGKASKDHRSPEFSDVMEYMVINPTWNVPYSIAVKEYLPMLQSNPHAVSHLQLLDGSGQKVSRTAVDFSSYSEGNFPYHLKEPPSQGNALGLVKFIFPNNHNIYLHDTPSKSLFNRESRAFSHGCIRLGDPLDFAYTLLGPQTKDPKAYFQARQSTGVETTTHLQRPIQVHLVYFTAYPSDKGMQYRRDIYGRDAQIFRALQAQGVALRIGRG
ncbi:MAG: L,D-transpeptidase family protein [Mangrovicoccus sp.]